MRGDSCQVFERDNHIDAILPDADNSDLESESDSDGDIDDEEYTDHVCNILSYKQICKHYSTDQKYLEKEHEYNWILGEKNYDDIPKNEYLLKDSDKMKIRNSSPSKLFETFFSLGMKKHIIEASAEDGLNISVQEFNAFLGIIILSIFNKRNAIKDYWSTNPLLECPIVRSAMSRNNFWAIKGKIKYSKQSEENRDDPAWRVRAIFEMFRRNIKCLRYFQTALSVDEMMVKFFGRLSIKQFIRNKPVRFGIKL